MKLWAVGGALLVIFLVAAGVLFYYFRPPKPQETVEVSEDTPYEIFTTTDGRLSFEYPSTWTRTEIQNLETVLPKNFVDKYNLAMPLILSDPRGAQISLSVYQFEQGTDLNAAMDAFEADLAEMGQPYNEVNRKVVGEMLVVESTVDEQEAVVRVRDVLFSVPGESGEVVYNLSLSAPQTIWGGYEALFSYIQNSTQLSR